MASFGRKVNSIGLTVAIPLETDVTTIHVRATALPNALQIHDALDRIAQPIWRRDQLLVGMNGLEDFKGFL